MGKWDALKAKYKKVPVEGSYLQKLDAVMASTVEETLKGRTEDLVPFAGFLRKRLKDLDAFELERVYLLLRKEKDQIESRKRVVELELESLTRRFVDLYEEAGETNKTFEDGVSIGLSAEPYPIVRDPAALAAWIKEKGLEEIFTVNWQTLTGIVKERLDGKVNEPLPDGVDIYMKDKLSCRGRGQAGAAE